MAPMKSIIRENAEKDPSYCPYCMRCPGLIRMKIVERFYWRCPVKGCGAEHDERDKPVQTNHSLMTYERLSSQSRTNH